MTTISKPGPHADRIRAAQRQFREKIAGLPERALRMRLLAMASKPVGLGEGQIDPVEQALAKQALDALKIEDGMKGALAEHARLKAESPDSFHPGDPDYHQRRRARIVELEEQFDRDQARLNNVATMSHSGAIAEAVKVYEAADAAAEDRTALREAASAHLAAERANRPEVALLAAAMAAKGE